MSKKKKGQSQRDPKKSDLAPHSPVEGFDRTRRAHRQERAEDYVELISSLIAEKGEARAVDLARSLGVSHVTVTRTLKRLQKAGWVTSEPYRAVFLTLAGEKLADASRARHKIVLDFLVAAGVPASIAHIDAEGIEHHVSPETLAVMENLAKRLQGETS